MEIRALGGEDAAGFRELRLEALRTNPEAFASSVEREEPWPLARFAERLGGAGDDRVFGAFADGGLIGTVGFYRDGHAKMRHRGHIWGMYVQPARRGAGAGRALLEAALEHARGLDGLLQVNLEVVTDNAPALALYTSLGFTQYGLERRALIVGGRALDEALLTLHLSP